MNKAVNNWKCHKKGISSFIFKNGSLCYPIYVRNGAADRTRKISERIAQASSCAQRRALAVK
jgi:hypothetical protein